MKVSDVMSRQVDFVEPSTSVKDVSQIIFGRGINGVPVCKNKKVIGFVTENDILSRFFPSTPEYIEDTVHFSNFENLEARVSEVLNLSVDNIMNTKPITVSPNTPLLRAQSLMFVNNVNRLPVIDNDDKLVGILSHGDVFRAVVGKKLPQLTDEEYHDWLSRHYDMVVRWEERLGHEVPDLTKLFAREGIDSILDIGCGTGEHDIALADTGFNVVGIESSSQMYEASVNKLKDLDTVTQERITFMHGDYLKTEQDLGRKFGAAIFMGNAFNHLTNHHNEIIKSLNTILKPKNSLVVIQIINFEKVFKVSSRYLSLNFSKAKYGIGSEYAFLEFYDPPHTKDGNLTLNMEILEYVGNKWRHKSTNSTPIANLNENDIGAMLKNAGFPDIEIYGGTFLGPLFKEPYNPYGHDWINIIGRR